MYMHAASPSPFASTAMLFHPLFQFLQREESLEPDKDDPADEPLAVPDDPVEEMEWYLSPFDESSGISKEATKLMKSAVEKGEKRKRVTRKKRRAWLQRRRRRGQWSLEPPAMDGAAVSDGGEKVCSCCLTRETPQWRLGLCGLRTLCNACGIRERRLKRGPVMEVRSRCKGVESVS